jgi:hypothetical protein
MTMASATNPSIITTTSTEDTTMTTASPIRFDTSTLRAVAGELQAKAGVIARHRKFENYTEATRLAVQRVAEGKPRKGGDLYAVVRVNEGHPLRYGGDLSEATTTFVRNLGEMEKTDRRKLSLHLFSKEIRGAAASGPVVIEVPAAVVVEARQQAEMEAEIARLRAENARLSRRQTKAVTAPEAPTTPTVPVTVVTPARKEKAPRTITPKPATAPTTPAQDQVATTADVQDAMALLRQMAEQARKNTNR